MSIVIGIEDVKRLYEFSELFKEELCLCTVFSSFLTDLGGPNINQLKVAHVAKLPKVKLFRVIRRLVVVLFLSY